LELEFAEAGIRGGACWGKEEMRGGRAAWALEFAAGGAGGRRAQASDELRLAMSLHVEPAIHYRLERHADARLRARARRLPLASSAPTWTVV
jgi:hypothetical protein